MSLSRLSMYDLRDQVVAKSVHTSLPSSFFESVFSHPRLQWTQNRQLLLQAQKLQLAKWNNTVEYARVICTRLRTSESCDARIVPAGHRCDLARNEICYRWMPGNPIYWDLLLAGDGMIIFAFRGRTTRRAPASAGYVGSVQTVAYEQVVTTQVTDCVVDFVEAMLVQHRGLVSLTVIDDIITSVRLFPRYIHLLPRSIELLRIAERVVTCRPFGRACSVPAVTHLRRVRFPAGMSGALVAERVSGFRLIMLDSSTNSAHYEFEMMAAEVVLSGPEPLHLVQWEAMVLDLSLPLPARPTAKVSLVRPRLGLFARIRHRVRRFVRREPPG